MLQRQLDVDILVTGHTHQFKAYKHEGGVVINPGSATGAYSSFTFDVNPSFVLMDIDGLRVVVYVYELIDGEVKVDKIDFKKTATTRLAHWFSTLHPWLCWTNCWELLCNANKLFMCKFSLTVLLDSGEHVLKRINLIFTWAHS